MDTSSFRFSPLRRLVLAFGSIGATTLGLTSPLLACALMQPLPPLRYVPLPANPGQVHASLRFYLTSPGQSSNLPLFNVAQNSICNCGVGFNLPSGLNSNDVSVIGASLDKVNSNTGQVDSQVSSNFQFAPNTTVTNTLTALSTSSNKWFGLQTNPFSSTFNASSVSLSSNQVISLDLEIWANSSNPNILKGLYQGSTYSNATGHTTPVVSNQARTVPEPSSELGVLVFGVLGLASTLKRKHITSKVPDLEVAP